jgi:membrane protein DedA with SNARE-associated domain
MIESVLRKLANLPALVIYVVIGGGAAVENFVPPIPADTFVLLGAFLVAGGRGHAWMVFLVTWLSNIGSAALVYMLTYRYGEGYFDRRFGRWLINPDQMKQVNKFYQRWGMPAIFVSRFLPTLRAMVPVFAGVTRVPFWRVFLPIAVASALWYGFVVYVGVTAGNNWDAVLHFFNRSGKVLTIVAGVVLALLAWWWWRTRRQEK